MISGTHIARVQALAPAWILGLMEQAPRFLPLVLFWWVNILGKIGHVSFAVRSMLVLNIYLMCAFQPGGFGILAFKIYLRGGNESQSSCGEFKRVKGSGQARQNEKCCLHGPCASLMSVKPTLHVVDRSDNRPTFGRAMRCSTIHVRTSDMHPNTVPLQLSNLLSRASSEVLSVKSC